MDDVNDILKKILSTNMLKNINKDDLLQNHHVTSIINTVHSQLIGTDRIGHPYEYAEIDHIPPEGIVIEKSGIYKLENDIKWMPNGNNIAIYIKTDDVIIDLNQHEIENCSYDEYDCNYENNKYETICIKAENASNITIMNGRIKNMTYYGIFGNELENITINDIIIDGIHLDNLEERYLTPAGLLISKSNGILINNLLVQNIDVLTDSLAGIQLAECTNGTISNCLLKDFVNRDGAVQGYSYILSSDIRTLHCGADNFQSFFNGNILTSGHTVLGFIPIFCMNLNYNYCTVKNMMGCCDDCHGFSVFLNTHVILNNIYVSNVVDGIGEANTGAKATGIEVYGGYINVNNCTVENIMAINPQDKQAAGYSVAGEFVEFRNCHAKNVTVYCDNEDEKSFGIGFGWAPDPRPLFKNIYAEKIFYRDCSASDCQIGFDTWFHINSVWNNASSIDSNLGILIENNSFRTLRCTPCSECNPPITTTLVNVAKNNVIINFTSIRNA